MSSPSSVAVYPSNINAEPPGALPSELQAATVDMAADKKPVSDCANHYGQGLVQDLLSLLSLHAFHGRGVILYAG